VIQNLLYQGLNLTVGQKILRMDQFLITLYVENVIDFNRTEKEKKFKNLYHN
jgi:hypothetical protein